MIKIICAVLTFVITVGLSLPGYAKGSKPKKESAAAQKSQETQPGYTGAFADPYNDNYQSAATTSAKTAATPWKIDGLILSEANHKTLMSKDDTVYVEFRPGKTVTTGAKCTVYRRRGKIRSYETKKGHKVKVVQQIGALFITDVSDNIATAKVTSSTEPLMEGDAVLIDDIRSLPKE